MHTFAAILCVVVAFVLTSVLVDEWQTAPGWVSALSIMTMIVLLVSAVRLYTKGAERRQKIEGPRTRIVLSDVPPPPPRPKTRHSVSGK